ncbi:MAG: hypothetical protein HS113_10550 [Verrucomicrobiales bacterium]|nr:hypothetical protein [Verrucomicrobiales bacterium]
MPHSHLNRRFRPLTKVGLLAAVSLGPCLWGAAPLALHPENPRYFQWRGQPTFLLGSGEHYGAVLNLDFDFRRYLDTLAADGLNHTRTFTGVYCEPPGAFNIARNTLAPEPNRLICPWARSDQPGYANGGNKFDLNRWDETYFERLRAFLTHASRRGVVVELTLFCPFYEDSMWRLSPMNAANNINGVGAVGRTNVYTLDRHGGLLPFQEALTRKLVTELKDFDNLYYELCNEPYFGGVTLAWQHQIAEVIVQTEQALGVRHLISRNVANDKARVENPHPSLSIFNFHYAYPPDTVAMNYDLGKVIGDNETGFRGTSDLPYRVEAWSFLLAGGGLFSHLDYSFVAGHEDGTFVYPAQQPGGGNPGFRRQMKVLGDFLRGFDFVRMRPETSFIAGGIPAGHRAYVLAEPRRAWAVYLARDLKDKQAPTGPQTATLELRLPAGDHLAEWVNPRTGAVDRRTEVKVVEGTARLASPTFEEDVALRIRRR